MAQILPTSTSSTQPATGSRFFFWLSLFLLAFLLIGFAPTPYSRANPIGRVYDLICVPASPANRRPLSASAQERLRDAMFSPSGFAIPPRDGDATQPGVGAATLSG
jgi:hypothetical protein